MTPESKLKAEIKEYLDSIPGLWHVPYTNHGMGRAGVPDRLVCYKGRFIAFEVKAAHGKPTPWQTREIAAIRAAGGLADVVYSVEDVQRWVEEVACSDGC